MKTCHPSESPSESWGPIFIPMASFCWQDTFKKNPHEKIIMRSIAQSFNWIPTHRFACRDNMNIG